MGWINLGYCLITFSLSYLMSATEFDNNIYNKGKGRRDSKILYLHNRPFIVYGIINGMVACGVFSLLIYKLNITDTETCIIYSILTGLSFKGIKSISFYDDKNLHPYGPKTLILMVDNFMKPHVISGQQIAIQRRLHKWERKIGSAFKLSRIITPQNIPHLMPLLWQSLPTDIKTANAFVQKTWEEGCSQYETAFDLMQYYITEFGYTRFLLSVKKFIKGTLPCLVFFLI